MLFYINGFTTLLLKKNVFNFYKWFQQNVNDFTVVQILFKFEKRSTVIYSKSSFQAMNFETFRFFNSSYGWPQQAQIIF